MSNLLEDEVIYFQKNSKKNTRQDSLNSLNSLEQLDIDKLCSDIYKYIINPEQKTINETINHANDVINETSNNEPKTYPFDNICPVNTLYIKLLSPFYTKEILLNIFNKYTGFTELHIIEINPEVNYAFINFDTVENATNALRDVYDKGGIGFAKTITYAKTETRPKEFNKEFNKSKKKPNKHFYDNFNNH